VREFNGMGEFAQFLGGVALAQHEAEKHLLERAARVVEKRAKERIGEYQGQVGSFAGWAELADSTKADRVAQGFSENEPGLRSGEMRDSISHVVRDGEAHIGSDDQNLVYFELGTSKQPPRSVLGGAAAEKTDEIVKIIGEGAAAVLAGEEVFGGRLAITGE